MLTHTVAAGRGRSYCQAAALQPVAYRSQPAEPSEVPRRHHPERRTRHRPGRGPHRRPAVRRCVRSPGENPHIQPVDFPLDVLYEDDDLLLLNKPAGIALHPAALTEEPVTLAGAVAFLPPQ